MLSLLLALTFFIAGFVQGLTGFGAALVAMPLLALLIDVKMAVPLCMLNGLVITGFLSLRLRRHLDRRKIMPLLLGSLPGVALGALFLKQAEGTLIRVLLGLMIVLYALYAMLRQPRPHRLHPVWSYLAGFATGVIGAAFSAGGPPTIIYTTLAGWSRDEIKATLSGFFLASGVLVAIAHVVAGVTTTEVLSAFAVTIAAVLAGVALGLRCSSRFNTAVYLKVVQLALVFMGGMMVLAGVFRQI